MQEYRPQQIEEKWQRRWQEEGLYETDIKRAKNPFYNLMMFPYPSGEGLHVGHVYAFSGADTFGRFKRLQGFDVFEPMGFDAFGIHSENYALKIGQHPREVIKKTTARYKQQLDKAGLGLDWRHTVNTTDPSYYKWTQWIFLQLYKAGLAVRKKAPVNWCPSCKTVLADEQVIGGKCERCDSLVTQKELKQWFFKITDFADKLDSNLDKIDWSEKVKKLQRSWIGKSKGALIRFPLCLSERKQSNGRRGEEINFVLEVFTTRPDTIQGATYMVLAPEHKIIEELKEHILNYQEVKNYIEKAKSKTEQERLAVGREKTGVEIKGIKAVNPFTKEKIPVWVADYVLVHYGTGAIMAVPDCDERDKEFAEKYHLPIKKTDLQDPQRVVEKLKGRWQVNYRLRDWLISRQRYWGPPIPIVYCQNCGEVPVPEEELPVLLPHMENFRPTGEDKSPLAYNKDFLETVCPQCKGPAKRETDVSDNFLDSAWYFLRYPSVDFDDRPFDPEITRKWLPVDMYIGGAEHSVLHLMYTRFITMALHQMGHLDFEEPFKKFRAHGLITKDGAKMSKSRGNVVNPDEYIEKKGADVFRMYLLFLGPYDEGGDFSDQGISGIDRFLRRVWQIAQNTIKDNLAPSPQSERKLHQTIKKVTEDLESLKFNTAIAALMEYVNELSQDYGFGGYPFHLVEPLIKMVAPFCPHITEEIWREIWGHKETIFKSRWPQFNPALVTPKAFTLVIQVNGRVRDKIEVEMGISKEEAERIARESKKLKRWLEGKEIKKIIFVPNRLINFVLS